MERKEKCKVADPVRNRHGRGSYDIRLNLGAWMEKIRALLIEDDQTIDDMAAQVRFGRTDRSNRKKVGEVLKKLANEGEAECYGDEYTQETWRLTLMGRLRQIKGEEMFNSICEASYVRKLIEGYGKGGADAASLDDYPPSAIMPYVEEDTGPVKEEPRKESPDIDLLTVDKRKCWCTGGELRECIVIPEGIGADTLKHDISRGAYPFEPLAKASKPDLKSKVVFIRVKKIEYGYKAAVYFAAIQNELDGMGQADRCYLDQDSFCLEAWDPAETGLALNIMPIVPAGSMIGYQLNGGIDMGVFGGAGLPQTNVKTPYWKYHRGPIIIIEPEAFFMSDDTHV